MQTKFKISSVTTAQRGQRLLRQNAILSRIERLQNPAKGEGCGYIIAVKSENEAKAQEILTNNNIRIAGVIRDDLP